jgi:hypothetical protein
MTAADVVHVLMRMGIDDLARIDALRRSYRAHIARSERGED